MDPIEPNQTISLAIGDEVFFDKRSGYITNYVDMESVMVREKVSGKLERVLIDNILAPKNARDQLLDNDLSLIPDESWRLAQDRFNIIEPLLVIEKRSRQDVEQRAEQFGKHPNTLYQWIKAYENQGNLRSLMNKSRKDSGSKRLNPEIEGIIDSCIHEHYLTRERKSISYVHRIVVTTCHKRNIDPPHQNTVRNRINAISEKHRVKKRHGGIISANKFAPTRGKTPGAETPFAMYQMDHTPMDIIVVDEDDRHPVGRPTLTMIIDVYSRMVAGFYISFEPPGALAAGMCMAHALLPKTKWLTKFNASSDWPIWGNPSTLHMDNAGEFRGDMLKLAAGEYQFTIEYRPVARPHYGGHIERLLGTFAQELKPLPGSTFSNTQERGNYESEKKSALTLSELEEWLTILIADGYHQKIHSSIGTTPLERFKEGVLGSATQPGVGMKPKITDDMRVQLDFMPFVSRTVSNEGVVIENVHYYHDVLRHWINTTEPNNKKLSRKFVFRRDPRDISTVWFFDPQLKQYFPIPYRDTSRPAVSVWEMRKARKLLLKGQREKVTEHELFKAYERMREIENAAIKKTMSMRRATARRKDAAKKSMIKRPDKDTQLSFSSADDLATEDIKPFDDLLEDFDEI